MSNKVLSGLAFDEHVRFYIVNSTALVNDIRDRLNTSAVCSAAIGRSASITGLMGLMLKNDESITTIIDGDGPIKQITAISDSKGKVRATMANPHVEIPLKESGKLDVSGAVGENGTLRVIKDLNLREPYNSQTNLISGEIANDYTYYFATSEQTPSAVSAGVLVDTDLSIKSAGALVVQLLPSASEEVIDKLEQAFLNLGDISSLLHENSLEDIIKKLFNDDYKLFDQELSLKYECNCSEEKYLTVLQNLNEEEKEELKQQELVECVCNFCNKKYNIQSKLI